MKNNKIITIALAVLSLAIAATGIYFIFFKSETNKNKDDKTKEQPKEQEKIEIKKLTIFDEDSNERPIAVMIDNNVGNNSHSGLQDSYLNYEIIVEGGLTRIMAIYKDKDISLIGPVRSSRHYFLDYALESDCIYTHFGWSPYAQKDVKFLGVNNINGLYDSKPFWRVDYLYAPHNVFTSTSKLYEYSTEKNYSIKTDNWQLLNYDTEEVLLNKFTEKQTIINPETGKEETIEQTDENLLLAQKINMIYSRSQNRSYVYDQINKVYLRYMNNAPHIDATTQQQLNYKNIIIQRVNNHQLDSEGRQDLDTVGTGDGFYITNGYSLPIKWEKSTRSSKTKYTYLNGKELILNDGNTFIQIVPLNSNITIE